MRFCVFAFKLGNFTSSFMHPSQFLTHLNRKLKTVPNTQYRVPKMKLITKK